MMYLAEIYDSTRGIGVGLGHLLRSDWRISLGVAAALLVVWGTVKVVRARQRNQEPHELEPPYGGAPAYASQRSDGQPPELSHYAQPPYPPADVG